MFTLTYSNHDDNSLENNIIFSIDFENFVAENFDIREMVVSSLLNDGFSVVEIAKHQRCSRRYITRVITTIRKKLFLFLKEY